MGDEVGAVWLLELSLCSSPDKVMGAFTTQRVRHQCDGPAFVFPGRESALYALEDMSDREQRLVELAWPLMINLMISVHDMKSTSGSPKQRIEAIEKDARGAANKIPKPTRLRMSKACRDYVAGGGAALSSSWLVRGHYRNQPCGPQRRERRRTWVAPHVKGPGRVVRDRSYTI